MRLRFLTIILFICSFALAQTKGTISGIITDKDANNATLPFANATIKGTSIATTTDENGKYTITVAPGNYTIVFSFLGYENIESSFSIATGETVVIDKALGSGSYKLEDVVVKSSGGREKETALLMDQKKAVVIKQSIGAQELSRKGVSDVEEGLTKITGITKVGSRGLFVRGLEDRYNNLLINDLAAPTNNPFKKIIPLDLFSTDIVSVIEVYKTFNPNIYGDFAGGTFDILTPKGAKSITKLSIGAGFTANNNLEKFLISKDANTTKGFFGLTGKDRELPGLLGDTPASKTFTAEESLKSFGENGFDVDDTRSPLNTSLGILHSEKFNFKNDRIFSYLLSINFENNYAFREGVERTFRNDVAGFKYNTDFDVTEYRYKTSLTGLLGLNYTTKRLKLSFNTLYIRTTEGLIKDQFGVPNSSASVNDALIRTNQLDQSDYFNNQLFGEYALTEDNNQTIKLGGSFAITRYQQPDRKFFSGTKTGDNEIIATIGGNNFIKQYLDIKGDSYVAALAEYNLKFGKEKANKLTVGYNGNASDMQSSYRFVSPTNNSAPDITGNVNTIDNQLNSYVSSGAFQYRESSNSTYQSKLKESANSGYANLFYKFGRQWEVNGGVRFENTTRETKYRKPGSFDDPFQKLTYDNMYILPALNVKYAPNENSNIRFATAKTYTRPVIMEAYPIEYINGDGTSIRGNALLENSDNFNADLKYEFFPTNKEIFAVGVFGKKIENPIERTFTANAANATIITYENSDNAVLYGAEIEFNLDLARLTPALTDFSWGFNTSLMQTKTEVKQFTNTIDPNDGLVKQIESLETHRSRDLQGASEWLINSDLKYQFNLNKTWSNTISVVYSVFGKRIYAVGTVGLDHIYELPVHQLDFVWSSKLSDHIDLKFSADNLIDPVRQLDLGNDGTSDISEFSSTTLSYKKGRAFSFTLNYTF